MKRLFLTLEDGTVFEGWGVNETLEATGLLSFYTGVVGYQEVISDPANSGKIILFTFPLIGNYGVNTEDSESASPKAAGIVTKEYSNIYSNFRATGNLADYLEESSVLLGTGFDTRAVMVHLREHGEMMAAISTKSLDAANAAELSKQSVPGEYAAENHPIACAQAHPRIKATVVDLGASKSFYKYLSAMGVDACCTDEEAAVVIVSDAPYYVVEQPWAVERVNTVAKGRPIIGFGHGSAVVAKAAGGGVKRVEFGDHGCNIPVMSIAGGRNEITVQNHNYEAIPDGNITAIFTNVHDGTCEGFKCNTTRAAGVNFLPSTEWFGLLLESVGVE